MKPSQPVAKRGDRVVAVDTHIVLVPGPAGPVPTPTPLSFDGRVAERPDARVFVDDESVAVEEATADNVAPHVPMGGTFAHPPENRATLTRGSATVFADDRAVARSLDPATSCDDLGATDNGHLIVDRASVFAG